MKTVAVTPDFRDFPTFDAMMSEAFPPEELFLPSDMAKLPNVRIQAYYGDDGAPVGMAVPILLPDAVFLELLVVDARQRGKGYGSQIVNQLLERFPGQTILGYVERPDPSRPDNEQRLRRIRFYERLGFTVHDIHTRQWGIDFLVIALGKDQHNRQQLVDALQHYGRNLPNVLRACNIPFEYYNDVMIDGKHFPME